MWIDVGIQAVSLSLVCYSKSADAVKRASAKGISVVGNWSRQCCLGNLQKITLRLLTLLSK